MKKKHLYDMSRDLQKSRSLFNKYTVSTTYLFYLINITLFSAKYVQLYPLNITLFTR